MGVQGLWTVLAPAARPTKLESLSHRRLAVDASIWIYQFLKAVRDAEGRQLRSSHIVGFFRRICKLLYFGIKPVFVFDGRAPELKRKTLARRRGRREGRGEEAAVTAGKLLAAQLRDAAEKEEEKRRESERKKLGVQGGRVEEEVPDNPVYMEELQTNMISPEKNKRRFRKTDQYDLPALETDFSTMGSASDPRIMSHEELEEYAKLFQAGENINLYDFSKIDFDSPFFTSLPAADRYNILNAARLRSRLRMGLSTEQLSRMFPNRMDFSRFQIERVRERNDLTQRLMNLNGMNDNLITEGRVAGEKGREYVLVKNNNVEGGWVLGVVEGTKEKPINVEKKKEVVIDEESAESDEEFEDVPIEGLNRLPKEFLKQQDDLQAAEDEMVRHTIRESRNERSYRPPPRYNQPALTKKPAEDTLFIQDDDSDAELFGASPQQSPVHDHDLEAALALSLAPRSPSPQASVPTKPPKPTSAPFEEIDEVEDDFVAAVAQKKGGIWSLKDPESASAWGGLLPFERLDFGGSSQDQITVTKETPKKAEKKQPAADLPPWFVQEEERDMTKEVSKLGAGMERESELFEVERPPVRKEFIDLRDDGPVGGSKKTSRNAVIDLIEEEDQDVIVLDSDEEMEEWDDVQVDVPAAGKNGQAVPIALSSSLERDTPARAPVILNEPALAPQKPTSNNLISPPSVSKPSQPTPVDGDDEAPLDWDESDHEATMVAEKGVTAVSNDLETDPNAPVTYEEEEPLPIEEMADLSFLGNDFTAQEEDFVIEDLTAEQEAAAIEEVENIEKTGGIEALEQELAEKEAEAAFARKMQAEQELRALRAQQRKELRDADDVTQQMVEECQELLQLFGLPYITSPQEAEAQCATLLELGLVDGIITDDSDVFLFGGTRVYRNFFNQGKQLETFLASDLHKELALTRERLIDLALLLGSDYTDGIRGIGPITAMEILSEFAQEGGLSAFHSWWETALFHPNSIPPATTPFKRKFLKSMVQKLTFPPKPFPDQAVIDAYLHPVVDDTTEPFQWGVPSLDLLREFLMKSIGWGRERTDEVLLPVIREMERMERQVNLNRYFTGVGGTAAAAGAEDSTPAVFAPRVRKLTTSARLLKAVGGLKRKVAEMDGVELSEESEDDDADVERTNGKGKAKAKEKGSPSGPISMRARALAEREASLGSEEDSAEEAAPKKKRGRGKGKKPNTGASTVKPAATRKRGKVPAKKAKAA